MVEPYDPRGAEDLLAIRNLGIAGIPEASGAVLGASAREGYEHAFPLSDVTRMIDETALIPPTGSIAWNPNADSGIAADLAARERETPTAQLLTPEEAGERYGIKDRLSWTRPVYADVAQEQRERKQEQMAREDIIARREHGLFTGGVARFVAGLAGGLPGIVDPLNIATSFLPVVGPAKAALWAAKFGVAGTAAVGAVEGAVGQALLLPLQYGISRYDQEDYGAVDALLNIAMGSAFGGGLHTGVHLWGRPLPALERRLGALGPEEREAALRQSIADVADGKQVNVAPLVDAFDAARTERELSQWATRQQGIERDTEAALTRGVAAEEQGLAGERTRAATASRLEFLREEHANLLAERQAAQERAATAIDPVTRERLAAVEQELGANPSARRRAELEAEARLLTEGTAIPRAEEELTQARAEAEAQGLTAALRRAQGRVAGTAEGLRRAEAAAEREGAASTRGLDAEATRLQSQQEVLQALTERSLWRLAGRAESTVTREEVSELARTVLAAKPEDAPAVIKAAIEAAQKGAPTPPARLPPEVLARAAPTPAPGEPTIRLYRGESSENVKGGGWFTTDPKKAALYGDVSYVDVTRGDLANFAQGHGGPDEWVTFNPEQLVGRLQSYTAAGAAAAPTPTDTTGLAGMGRGMAQAMSANLYEGLFKALSEGTDTFAGIRDPVIARARPAFEAGQIKSPEDLRNFVNNGYRAADTAAAPTVPDVMARASARTEQTARAVLEAQRQRGEAPPEARQRPIETGREPGDVTTPPKDPTEGLTAEQQIAAANEDTQYHLQNLEREAAVEGKLPPDIANDPEYQATLAEAARLEDSARALEQSGVCLSRNA